MNLENILSVLGNNWIVVVVVLLLGWVVAIYNRLVKAELLVESSWADIDTLLKKRFDLIPNLVETVKGYAQHEQGTLEQVVEARSKASQIVIDIKSATPEQMAAYQSAQGELSQMLGKLFALSEQYPDLKADSSFLNLQKELSDVEGEINMARRMYNGTVKTFNEITRMFPTNIIAKLFGFADKSFFEADESEKENVNVKF